MWIIENGVKRHELFKIGINKNQFIKGCKEYIPIYHDGIRHDQEEEENEQQKDTTEKEDNNQQTKRLIHL